MTIFVSFFVAGNSGTVPHESISMRIIEHTLPDSIGVFGSWVALEDSELETLDVNSLIDHLISRLRAVSSGNSDAGAYHALMVGILEFIFYPNLINPVKELEINQGRKRIDISFDNGAPTGGVFSRLQHNFGIPCPYIFFECKNYSRDIHNPELDQMVGRLSPNRGKFGVIVCRSFEDEATFLRRCSDSYSDQHGLIVPLTDADIIQILEQKRINVMHFEEQILSDKSRMIMNRS